jgi:hypothetical protein
MPVRLLLLLGVLGCDAEVTELDVADAAADVDVGAAVVTPLAPGLATLFCQYLAQCFPGSLVNQYGGLPDCLEDTTSSFSGYLDDLEPLITAGQLSLDKGALEACLATPPEARRCDRFLELKQLCPGAFRGQSGPGEACGVPEQCEGKASCLRDLEARCGTCQPVPGLGERCPFLTCAEGSTCEIRLGIDLVDASICVAADLPVGASCGPSVGVCAPQLACLGEGAPTCQPTVAEGEPCDQAGQASRCARTLGCGPDGRCAPLRQGSEGDTCRDGVTICGPGLICSQASAQCQVAPGIGAPCLDFQCSDEAFCKEGTCRAKILAGSRCDLRDECASPYVCLEDRCRVAPAPPTDCGP